MTKEEAKAWLGFFPKSATQELWEVFIDFIYNCNAELILRTIPEEDINAIEEKK